MSAPARPRISFGMIVLNGEPFTRYALRTIYPFASEIIVVEGASPGARNVATPDGHSRDGTLAALDRFKAEEDVEDKVTIVTAESEGHPSGFWPGEKDEQSRAYAVRATGNYLWQVDVDEFYLARDLAAVQEMLRLDPGISGMTFKQTTFWGGLEYWVDGWYLRRGATYYHRLFKWGPGYAYLTHRPPTVVDEAGRDLRSLKWISGTESAAHGLRLFHYSLLLPKQVLDKCDYYQNATWAERSQAIEWAEGSFVRLGQPYRVHNVYDYPSWLERFNGEHPPAAISMMETLAATAPGELRRTDDIERLLGSRRYAAGRAALKVLEPVDRLGRSAVRYGRAGAARLVPRK